MAVSELREEVRLNYLGGRTALSVLPSWADLMPIVLGVFWSSN